MRTLRIILAVLLLVYSIPAVLSVLDIMQGTEPDLSTEWIILLTYLGISILFALVTIVEAMKKGKSRKSGETAK